MRLRAQSHIGWLMLQWLGALVPATRALPVRQATATANGGAVALVLPDAGRARVHCGCCGREVSAGSIDGLYGCCDDCATCLSLGNCYDPDAIEGDRWRNLRCCHGENHQRRVTVDRAKGTITFTGPP